MAGYALAPSATEPNNFFTTIASLVLNGSGDKIGAVFQSLTDDAITHVGYRQSASAGTPPTYKIGLQSVSSGSPSGTYVGGGSPASGTFTPTSATDGEWVWIALDNSYTPTRGDLLATVLEYSSGTIDASNNITASYSHANSIRTHPYALSNTAAWAHAINQAPIFGYRTASNRYGRPIQNITMASATATSGHRRAVAYTFGGDGVDSFTISGMWIYMDSPTTGSTLTFGLWDASSLLASNTLTGWDFTSTSADGWVFVAFSSTPSLTTGTKYYVGVQADGTAFEIGNLQVKEAADLDAWGASGLALATFDTSTWTETATECPVIFPVINSVTPQVGGAGAGSFMLLGVG